MTPGFERVVLALLWGGIIFAMTMAIISSILLAEERYQQDRDRHG